MEPNEITYLEDGVMATFFVKPKLDNFLYQKTLEETGQGVKEFINQEYVSIRIPADKMSEIVEEVMPHHKHRFKNTYKAFKEGTSLDNGIPIANFGDLDPATIEKLKYLGVTTVEALASVSDGALSQIGTNARDMRDRAIRYLDNSSANKTSEVIHKQNEEIQALKAQMEALLAEKNDDEPRRGRPPKLPPHMKAE